MMFLLFVAATKGVLRVDGQGALARYFLMPGIADFFARYPLIELTMSEPDRYAAASHFGAKGGRTKRWSFGRAAMAARSSSSSRMRSAARLAF